MAGATLGAALRQVRRLFEAGGSAASQEDGQLLDRFIADRDEAAFEALVDRHGPMVLGTARAILKDAHDAEDAFQAAFVELARRARAIRGADSLGGWLHRVAYREAVRAKTLAGRRRSVEIRAAEAREGIADPGLDEIRAGVHAEVDRLPETFRLPVVLCDLQGLTKGEAADQLGWTEATVRGRLERARRMLRVRLERRGIGPVAGLAAIALGREAVGSALLAATARAALAAWPRWGLALASGARLKAGLATMALGGALVAIGMAGPGEPPAPPPTPPAVMPAVALDEAAPAAAVPAEEVEVRGRVLDPAGRPVAGATVQIDLMPNAIPRQAGPPTASGGDGRFTVRGPRHLLRDLPFGPEVLAWAPGSGLGWAKVGRAAERGEDLDVRLSVDDVPLEGRVVDLEGRPVGGAQVRVEHVWSPKSGDLGAWMALARDRGVQTWGPWEDFNEGRLDAITTPPVPPATAGPDGRFVLRGVGRERIAGLLISGPGVATGEVYALTRAGEPTRTADGGQSRRPTVYHASRFDHAASPGRAIEGTIADDPTGRPIPGVLVRGMIYDEGSSLWARGVEATSDESGRYRLLGLGQGSAYRIFLIPAEGSPYNNAGFRLDAGPIGRGSARGDFALRRAVVLKGRLVDKATGRPVPRASIQAYTFDGPGAREFPGLREGTGNGRSARTDAEGRYELATVPGRGVVIVSAPDDSFLTIKPEDAARIEGFDRRLNAFRTLGNYATIGLRQALAEVRPEDGSDSITLDLEVDSGRTVAGTVLDPEGRPIGGTKAIGLGPMGLSWSSDQEPAGFQARGLEAGRPRRVFFFHEGRKLAGSALIRGDEPGPVAVKLQPWGSVVGRLVDAEGRPKPKVELNVPGYGPEVGVDDGRVAGQNFHADRDGRFRIDRLVPGLAYRGSMTEDIYGLGRAFEGVVVAPGEVKDLGEIKVPPRPE